MSFLFFVKFFINLLISFLDPLFLHSYWCSFKCILLIYYGGNRKPKISVVSNINISLTLISLAASKCWQTYNLCCTCCHILIFRLKRQPGCQTLGTYSYYRIGKWVTKRKTYPLTLKTFPWKWYCVIPFPVHGSKQDTLPEAS